ncbi:MAG: hypothetical protein LBE59_04780 [Nevskiaceae bacterium]|jgi:hypothetical protein|nr:hypothetical protein [Nevskiaceae bacterium]
MSESNKRTYFFRPSRVTEAEPILNPDVVATNARRGVETTLLLDTNVLIRMEYVVKGGNKRHLLKEHGLHNLVNLLGRCPPKSICLSPGLAFEEMPPACAERSRIFYETFCAVHLPQFIDTPNCDHRAFAGKDRNYGYLDLEPARQALLAIPYTSLLYLIIIDKSFSGGAIQKFKEFLRRLSCDLDILSAKETEIAKYCFAEGSLAGEIKDVRDALRDNFLKTRGKKSKLIQTYDQAIATAFNGANDLAFINAANIVQTRGLDGVPQDCWIATCDKKLFAFSRIFHYLNVDGEAGKYAVTHAFSEQHRDEYWRQAVSAQQILGLSRMQYHLKREVDPLSLPELAKAAMDEAARVFGQMT